MTEQAIPELNPGPVVQFNDDGIITSLNWSAFAILGKDVKRGAQVREAIPGLAEVDIASAIHDGAVTTHIAQVRDRYYQFTVRGFKNLNMGGVYGTDVTERLQLEEALAHQVSVRQAEKMAALGKLASGMAHWLNNPAAAATRSANQLASQVQRMSDASARLSQRGLLADQWAALSDLRMTLTERYVAGHGQQLDALEQSECEDEVIGWLDARGAEDSWESAPVLVRAGLDVKGLGELSQQIGEDAVGDAAAWLAACAETAELLEVIQGTTATISGVIEAFKNYTFMDQGEVQELDVNAGIDQTLEILQHRLANVAVEREYDEALPRIMGSGSELNQVWTNLIDNAIDAMDGQGVIHVRTFVADGQLKVQVADQGVGIPEEEQYRVFEPFYTTKDVGEGTGLGLDIVRRTVEETFGGRVTFRSKPGETVFEVSLPLDKGPSAT